MNIKYDFQLFASDELCKVRMGDLLRWRIFVQKKKIELFYKLLHALLCPWYHFFPFHGLKVVTQRNVDDSPFTNTITGRKFSLDPTGWSWYMESVGVSGNNSFTASGLLEQINTTKDTSDFLWYSTRYFLHLLTMCNAWMRQIHYDTWKKKLV